MYSREDELRLNVKKLKGNAILEVDGLTEFIKRRAIDEENGILKIVLADYFFYAIEQNGKMYIARRKEALEGVKKNLEEKAYNDFAKGLLKLIKRQGRKEVIMINEKYFDFAREFIKNYRMISLEDFRITDNVLVSHLYIIPIDEARQTVTLTDKKFIYLFNYDIHTELRSLKYMNYGKLRSDYLMFFIKYRYKIINF